MMNANNPNRFDAWFHDDGPAALVLRESLQPASGDASAIFPPTYAPEQGSASKKSEYVLDQLKDGQSICQIDSVGSQGNRLEPLFKSAPYDTLVPQVTIVAGDQKVNLLDAGHRAADAIVRFSDLQPQFDAAFTALLAGDASTLARLAPTSLVFGVWDSRGTMAKAPRIVASTIRASDVEVMHRSAQYIPPVEYTAEILGEAAGLTDEQRSGEGLAHAPATNTLGGVLVKGEIRREATLNLVALRTLGVPKDGGSLDAEATTALRRYILGLALVALTKPMSHNLRQGCLLVGVEEKPATWHLVHPSGKREPFAVSHDDALAYAKTAAVGFGVKGEPITGHFIPKRVKQATEEKAQEKAAKQTRGRAAAAKGSANRHR
jgi:CRISPR-associated protein Csb1